MKIVGHRKEPKIEFHASSSKLKEGALFNDQCQKMLKHIKGFFIKGVYHYKNQNDANKHLEELIIKNIRKYEG